MDQAASLRQLMNKINGEKREAEATPVAFASLGKNENVDLFLKSFTTYYSSTAKKKIALFGVKNETNQIENYMMRKKDLNEIKSSLNEGTFYIPGSLDIMETVRNSASLSNRFIQMIKKIEGEVDYLFYHTGEGINPISINLARASDKLVFIVKPDEESILEASNYLKVLFKTKSLPQIGVIINTSDPNLFNKLYKKLQDKAFSELNYNIEAIGSFDFRYLNLFNENEIFEDFHFQFFSNERKGKVFSDILSNMLP